MNIFEKMGSLNNFTHNEEALMSFIMREPNRFIELKPKEIAKEAYVSLSTIYRFADKLDLDGITALKVELIAAMMEKEIQEPSYDLEEISSLESPLQYLGQLRDLGEKSIHNTYLNVKLEQLHIMKELLNRADKIMVFSSYSNVWFANNFQYQMQEIGKTVQVPIEKYSFLGWARNLSEKDLAIIVSINGLSATMMEVAEIAQMQHCPLLLITANPGNPLISKAQAVFMMEPIKSGFDSISDFSVRYSVLYAFDCLYMMCFKNDFSQHWQKRESTST